jgi:hypothetical protein
MQRLKVEAEITIFLLFFGTAMLDALRHHKWPLAAVYIVLCLMFLVSGRNKQAAGK